MKTNNDPVKPKKGKVQTTKSVTVSNKPKKKGPVAKMGELETRARATMLKAAEAFFGFNKSMRSPNDQRILNKDAALYNERAKKEKLVKEKQAKTRKKVEDMQTKGYNKTGFKTGGMVQKITARKKK